jgi:VacB/RNase II family 3'-5' exoribonuclease
MNQQDPAKPMLLAAIAHKAMLQRGLEPDFSKAVRAELAAIDGPARKSGADIRDLRGLPWCSIDNDDSRDLDQLTVSGANGSDANILVAISDVDALVTSGSAIDIHAAINTTSVYTAAGIFPMLPEKLSTDLTSLGEGDERLAIVVDMDVNDAGEVTASAVYPAIVRNHAKLAYNAVAAWLDGSGPAPQRVADIPGLDVQLRAQDAVAQCLKRSRSEKGALTLETLEVRPVFEEGALADLRPDTKNRAKELIENFMVAANVATASFLGSRRFPSLRRVLRSP